MLPQNSTDKQFVSKLYAAGTRTKTQAFVRVSGVNFENPKYEHSGLGIPRNPDCIYDDEIVSEDH